MRFHSYHKLTSSSHPPRETTFDLYTEAERLPWYFKALSTFSAWLVLSGYVLFSIAYTSPGSSLRISSSVMTGLAATGVILGYLSDFALAFLSRSLIFTFDGVLMPVLTASAVGLFSTIVHRALKKDSEDSEDSKDIYLWLPLAVASAATVVSVVLSWIVYRKLRNIKQLDARRRMHIPLNDTYGRARGSPMYPHNVSREVQAMVPDDEQQRRQLMHLLMANADRDRHPSMDATSSTYRIDLPGEEAVGRQRSGSLPPLASLSASTSGTTTKSVGSKFTITNLLPKTGRERAGSGETFKDPRERRREQIERSSLAGSPGLSPGLGPGWHGHGPGQRYSSPAQESARYE